MLRKLYLFFIFVYLFWCITVFLITLFLSCLLSCFLRCVALNLYTLQPLVYFFSHYTRQRISFLPKSCVLRCVALNLYTLQPLTYFFSHYTRQRIFFLPKEYFLSVLSLFLSMFQVSYYKEEKGIFHSGQKQGGCIKNNTF